MKVLQSSGRVGSLGRVCFSGRRRQERASAVQGAGEPADTFLGAGQIGDAGAHVDRVCHFIIGQMALGDEGTLPLVVRAVRVLFAFSFPER